MCRTDDSIAAFIRAEKWQSGVEGRGGEGEGGVSEGPIGSNLQ